MIIRNDDDGEPVKIREPRHQKYPCVFDLNIAVFVLYLLCFTCICSPRTENHAINNTAVVF